MQPMAGIGRAVCHTCGNEWTASGDKKRYKCPICGKYQVHFVPRGETGSVESSPETGEMITNTPVVQSGSPVTSPSVAEPQSLVSVIDTENTPDEGENADQGNLTTVALVIFLIGAAYAGWYLWKTMIEKRRTPPLPVPLNTLYGYERHYP